MKYLPAYQVDPSAVQDAILQTMIKMNRMFIPVQIDHLRWTNGFALPQCQLASRCRHARSHQRGCLFLPFWGTRRFASFL